MQVRDSNLRGLPVFTENGTRLGRVVSIIIETANHEVVHYAVKRPRRLADPLPGELLVHPRQIISVDDRKMVVQDLLIKEGVRENITLGEHAAGTATPGVVSTSQCSCNHD